MARIVRQLVALVVLAAAACGDGGGKAYRFAAPAVPAGTLDPAFGEGGIVRSDFRSYEGVADLFVLADGRIVAGGSFSGGAEGQSFGLARYHADGALDRSFGRDGLVVDVATQGPDRYGVELTRMVRAPDGSIVAAGCIGIFPPCDWSIARYSAEGELDASFGVGGVVVIERDGPPPRGLAVTDDGSVIIVSSTSGTTASDYLVTKLSRSGSPDPSFGQNGEARIDVGEDAGESVFAQADGKIVVGGCTGEAFTLLRLLPDGSLDAGFGERGAVVTSHPALRGTVRVVLPGPDEGYIAVGSVIEEGFQDGAVARFTGTGTLDSRFGEGGVAALSPLARSIRFDDAVLGANGAIVACGGALLDDAFVVGLVRLDAHGVLDPAFGTDGIVTTRIGDLSEAHAVALAPDGGIVVGGLSIEPTPVFTLARYGGGTR